MEYYANGIRPSSGRFDRHLHSGDFSTSYSNPSTLDSYVVKNSGGLEMVIGGSGQLRDICQTPAATAAADHHHGCSWPESAASSSLQWAKMQQQLQQHQGEPFSYNVAATSGSAAASLGATAMSLMTEAQADHVVGDRRSLGLLEATASLQPLDREMPGSYSPVQFGSDAARFLTHELPFRQQMAIPFPPSTTVPLALVQSLLGTTDHDGGAGTTVPSPAIVESSSVSQYRITDQELVGAAVDRMGTSAGVDTAGLDSPSVTTGLKRIGDRSTDKAALLHHHHRKSKAEKNDLGLPPGAAAAAGKQKFPSSSLEQPEHIVRERQRRDDMASKFAVLESFLPPSSKRDRSAIVSDSAEYVKNLHHRINVLRQRRMELMNVAASSPPVVQQQYSSNKLLQDQSYDPQAAAAAACHQVDSKKFSNTTSVSRSFPTEEELSESNIELKSCVEKLEVFVDLPHKLVIHMMCRPQPKFQSNMLQGMESLQLEVLQSNISRVAFGHVICIISAKPWDGSAYDAMCKDRIIVAVNCALGPDSSQKQHQTKQGPQLPLP
ncbi:unnamed protein product [Sphagnum jensenii]|uniref:BHLH domain-containing protein n=1 Tax=Sphagnum jensenii TaxID=128206 RepID=A0ABP1B568_9BRYO